MKTHPRRLATQRRYRERNREKLRAAYAKYVSDPGVHARKLKQNRKWRQANPEKGREYARRHRAKYPQQISDYNRAYKKNNPATFRMHEAQRRAQRNGVSRSLLGGHSAAFMLTTMRDLMSRPCSYCGTTENIEVDHIVPLTRGGLHHPQNLTAACRRCNSSKHNRLIGEWIASGCAPLKAQAYEFDAESL